MIGTFQIDNAQNFADMGGFNIVKEALNNSDVDLRRSASFLLGSAAQKYTVACLTVPTVII